MKHLKLVKRRVYQLGANEYFAHRDDSDGFCLHCFEVTNIGGVEPDAEGYLCEICDAEDVMGVELAMACGHIEVTE